MSNGRAFSVDQTDTKVEWFKSSDFTTATGVKQLKSFQIYSLDFDTDQGQITGGTAILERSGQQVDLRPSST